MRVFMRRVYRERIKITTKIIHHRGEGSPRLCGGYFYPVVEENSNADYNETQHTDHT